MKRYKRISGRYRLEITSADTASFLNALTSHGIEIMDIECCDDLVLQFSVMEDGYKELCQIAEKQGTSVKIKRKSGAYWTVSGLKKRPVLIAFLLLLLLLFSFVPTRILFVDVEGNVSVPTNQIIEAAVECGIGFGASRRQIRSEKMKNALLQKIPQLQWAGINTSGCTAVISVREKSLTDGHTEQTKQVSSIVALRDGIIQSCTVRQGNSLCTVGQAVKAGQTLVSGYTDLGIFVQATKAEAEIRALTSHDIEVIAPVPATVRGELKTQKTSYSLRIGKKLIKLTKDSGILGTSCAKIYSEEYLCLPGGYRLPIVLVKETVYNYDSDGYTPAAEDDQWLFSFARGYLRGVMIAGQIVSEKANTETVDGASYLYGHYACIEMIGQVKYEQTILKDGPDD